MGWDGGGGTCETPFNPNKKNDKLFCMLCRQAWPRWNAEGKWIDADLTVGLVGKLNAVMSSGGTRRRGRRRRRETGRRGSLWAAAGNANAIEEGSVVMEVINALRGTLNNGLPGDIVEFGAGEGCVGLGGERENAREERQMQTKTGSGLTFRSRFALHCLRARADACMRDVGSPDS